MDESLLDIGEVAARTGLAPSALRFYEKKGLIAPEARNGLRRAYRPEVLEHLGLITCARSAGLSLAEIGSFLQEGRTDDQLRRRAAAKACQVEEQIDRLTRLQTSLEHAATCTHEPLVDCPEFRRAIRNVYAPEDESDLTKAG